MEAKIRREQSTLFYSGLAVLVFGIWGTVKSCIYFYLNPEELGLNGLEAALGPIPEDVDTRLILTVVFLIIVLTDFLFRYLIGSGAIKESFRKRQKRKNGYRILAILYLIGDVLTYVHAVQKALAAADLEEMVYNFGINNIIVLLIEITSCLAMVELIVASFKLRRYRRNLEIMV